MFFFSFIILPNVSILLEVNTFTEYFFKVALSNHSLSSGIRNDWFSSTSDHSIHEIYLRTFCALETRMNDECKEAIKVRFCFQRFHLWKFDLHNKIREPLETLIDKEELKVIKEANPSQTTSELETSFGFSDKIILIHFKQFRKRGIAREKGIVWIRWSTPTDYWMLRYITKPS